MVPEIKLSEREKSTPKFVCSVGSHVSDGFEILLSIKGTLVPLVDVPYNTEELIP